jgi:hypothetical protein
VLIDKKIQKWWSNRAATNGYPSKLIIEKIRQLQIGHGQCELKLPAGGDYVSKFHAVSINEIKKINQLSNRFL